MKYLNGIFIFLTVTGLFFGCKKQDIPAKPGPTPFSVTARSTQNIAPAGGQVMVDIKGPTDGWWISVPEDASWCTASRKYGSGEATVTLTFKANASGAARTVAVMFNPTFDLPAVTLNFTQDK